MVRSEQVFKDAGYMNAEDWAFIGVFKDKKAFCEAMDTSEVWADDFSSPWLFVHTEEGVYVYEENL